MSYFPKLTAGPIERAKAFLPKLGQKRIVDNELLAKSFNLIMIGLFRKMVVADTLMAAIPKDFLQAPSQLSSFELITWLLAYAFGIYNDFAGYTDIARGVSGLFGIELSQNFAHPIFSRNFTEFWNRWHITLSHWLRDYIYYPFSRNLARRNLSRFNVVNLILPPLMTMMASGLWHGIGWNFLLWGILMGTYQVIGRLSSLWRPAVSPDKRPFWYQAFSVLFIFSLCLLSLVPFIMDLTISIACWREIFSAPFFGKPDSRVFWVMVPALWIDWTQYREKDEAIFLKWPRPIQSALLAVAVLSIFLAGRSSIGEPFIYQGF